MSKQTINLGTAPTGVGGDTPRSAFTKAQSNIDELYAFLAATGSPATLPAVLTASRLAVQAMLGTVSQSGGVPTGALFESGSNASGTYIRFADGTQICFKHVAIGGVAMGSPAGAVFYSSGLTVGGYAATFVGIPTTEITIQTSTALCWNTSSPDSTNLQFGTIYVISPISTSATVTLNCIAIGRWF
ncbi:hypothetical protein BI292_06175 [Pseudomonas sp. 43NM1]|uniref:hypothetical protein n=1 Tax=Pseudomonas sp. 43NM1 TaxID=1904755 RepID=UPI000CCA9ACF|nr:hypothetical protein [Pseudomonas sp. 43NM1]PKH12593.1 hypothetical protein BI292_06175 [Pseudomonas sp. 43NM1]